MKMKAYNTFKRHYRKLPSSIQKKVDKTLTLLVKDIRYPSLHVKKIKGRDDIWEARIDLHYRLTFEIQDETIFLRVVGNHDEALKNP